MNGLYACPYSDYSPCDGDYVHNDASKNDQGRDEVGVTSIEVSNKYKQSAGQEYEEAANNTHWERTDKTQPETPVQSMYLFIKINFHKG